MPLNQIPGGGDRDDDAGARLTDSPADELAHGLGGGPPRLREQRAPSAEQESEQPRDRQGDVTVMGAPTITLDMWLEKRKGRT